MRNKCIIVLFLSLSQVWLGSFLAISQGSADESMYVESLRSEAQSMWRASEHYLNQGQCEEALLVLFDLTEKAKNFPPAYHRMGQAWECLGERWKSIEAYTLALRLNPDFQECRFDRASHYYKNQQYAFAIEDYQYLLNQPAQNTHGIFYRLDPMTGEGVDMISINEAQSDIYNQIALCYKGMNKLPKAIETYTQGLLAQPRAKNLLLNRAQAYVDLHAYPEAVRDYEKVLQVDPENYTALEALAQLMRRSGEKNAELSMYSQLIENNPDAPGNLYVNRAMLYLERDKPYLALEDLEIANRINPEDEEVLIRLAYAHQQIGEYQEAISILDQLIDLNQDHGEAYLQKANILYKNRQFKRAIDFYSTALYNLGPKASIYHNRGLSYFYTGDYSNACSDLTKSAQYGLKNEKALLKSCAQ